MKKLILVSSLFVSLVAAPVFGDESQSKSPEDAKVYFITPMDGETVGPQLTVKFGLSGMGVAPAGTVRNNTGHHHLLIDGEMLPDMNKPLPATETIKHFGGGQTEAVLTLSPGEHTLQLLLGDFAHTPHSQPVLSKKITIIVQ